MDEDHQWGIKNHPKRYLHQALSSRCRFGVLGNNGVPALFSGVPPTGKVSNIVKRFVKRLARE